MNPCSGALCSRLLECLKQLCCASLLVSAMASSSAAQSADLHVQPSEREMRMSFQLDDALIEEAHRAYVWRVTWTAIYAGLTIGAVAAVPLSSDTDAPSLWIGAISSGVSALYSWFLPLDVEQSAATLESLREVHGSASRRTRVGALYSAASADERSRVTWPWHALNAVFSLVPAIILWAGFDQFAAGLLQFGAGVVLGEAAMITQPNRLTGRPVTALARRGLCFTF
ncbi:MAG TPA: hypothetical protein VFN67_09715 [Polyangiales bacterium]|nr:hypothetical protein [Polyangiales bacterium]